LTTLDFSDLWREASSIWDELERARGFEAYVPADYAMVLKSLVDLQGKASTFLEWGSGLGVVTIMASALGFEAYGLEVAPELVEHAERLAIRYAPKAVFGTGSFVPNAYTWDPEMGEDGLRTDFDASDGYDELGMDLQDFDIVYAYPWPDEHSVFRDIMKRHGADRGLFLTFDVREGTSVFRNRKPRK
jgi:hypothetical protein